MVSLAFGLNLEKVAVIASWALPDAMAVTVTVLLSNTLPCDCPSWLATVCNDCRSD